MCRAAALVLPLLLAACDPQAMVADVQGRAARSVVVNVLVVTLPQPQAEAAADCLLSAATPAERDALSRDVGARAGTSTEAMVRALAARPAARACLAARGLSVVT